MIATHDAVILGRRSYDEWVGFWPGSEIEPFATFINTVPKYVATSTPLDPEWANASAIDGGLVDFVRDLKDQPGGDIGVDASISVAQALLTATAPCGYVRDLPARRGHCSISLKTSQGLS